MKRAFSTLRDSNNEGGTPPFRPRPDPLEKRRNYPLVRHIRRTTTEPGLVQAWLFCG
jgi:hypothetical protein